MCKLRGREELFLFLSFLIYMLFGLHKTKDLAELQLVLLDVIELVISIS
jgi:hypothetical protein